MLEKVVRLDSSKGQVEVEIAIGQGQWGTYKLFLWDKDGLSPQQVGAGLNLDQVPDTFTINPPVSCLNGFILTWEVSVIALGGGPDQIYSVVTTVKQQGNAVPGGEIANSGSLNGAVFVFDFIRMLV